MTRWPQCEQIGQKISSNVSSGAMASFLKTISSKCITDFPSTLLLLQLPSDLTLYFLYMESQKLKFINIYMNSRKMYYFVATVIPKYDHKSKNISKWATCKSNIWSNTVRTYSIKRPGTPCVVTYLSKPLQSYNKRQTTTTFRGERRNRGNIRWKRSFP